MSTLRDIVDFDRMTTHPLRIQRRGDFFSDDGFSDFRAPFETAASTLLREFDDMSRDDPLRSYRNIRDRQLAGTDRAATVAEEKDKFKIVMDVEGYDDADLHVKVTAENELVIEGRQEKKNGCTSSNRSFARKFKLPGDALLQQASSSLSSDSVLTVTVPKPVKESVSQTQEQTRQTNHLSELERIEKELRDSQRNKTSTSSIFDNLTSSTSKDFVDLKITPRKNFFDDSFFEPVRCNFKKSVEDIVDRRRARVDSSKDTGIFRKLRETKEDNIQALSVTEDEKDHKIVLDVHGYSEGDLKVRAVSETELVVEGKIEKKTDTTSCSSSFQRRFVLPSSVDIRGATSALSSDGILTLTIPKKPTVGNFNIPVSSDAATHISNVIEKEQEKDFVHNTTDFTNTKSTVKSIDEQMLSNLEKQIEVEKKSTDVHKKEHIVPVTLADSHVTNEKSQVNITRQTCTENVSKRDDTTGSHVTGLTDISKLATDSTRPTARVIPISYKGSLYNEPVFNDTRKTIEDEVKNVYTNYRRSTSEEQKNQSVTSCQDSIHLNDDQSTSALLNEDHEFKIVVDVLGFEEHELKVRVSGLNEITIEGYSEKIKDGTKSKHSFQRSINLPDHVDIERTSTALSQEGILTITVPKKNQLLLKNKNIFPVTTKLEDESTKSKEIKTTLVVDSTGIIKDSQTQGQVSTEEHRNNKTVTSTQETSTTAQTPREFIVPVSIEDTLNSSSVKISQNPTTSSISSMSNTSRDISQGILSNDTSTSSILSQIENKTISENENRIPVTNTNEKSNITTNISKDIESQSILDLPLVSKGHFFDDSFFQDSQGSYENILRKHMKRFDRTSSFVDDLGFFKSLREKRLTGESQMDSMSEDEKCNTIVIDVNGFNERNLKVKALSQREIQIHGEVEEKTGGTISKRKFKKSFVLPANADVKLASSALSSDGILTIKVPKKQ